MVLEDKERRIIFLGNVLAQALGTALGAGLILVAGLAVGAIGDADLSGVGATALAVAASVGLLALVSRRTEAAADDWLDRRKDEITRESEPKLRAMDDLERLKFFVPVPGGFARSIYVLERLKEPLKREVDASLVRARRETEG